MQTLKAQVNLHKHVAWSGPHTCHKMWTKICEIRQNFKRDLTKFRDIFITLELSQYSLKSFFPAFRSLWKPESVDLCLFLYKICCGLKILWDLIFLWELPSRCAKFCEILSHSVRYGIYGTTFTDCRFSLLFPRILYKADSKEKGQCTGCLGLHIFLTLSTLGYNFRRWHFGIIFFPRKQILTFHANCLQWT